MGRRPLYNKEPEKERNVVDADFAHYLVSMFKGENERLQETVKQKEIEIGLLNKQLRILGLAEMDLPNLETHP